MAELLLSRPGISVRQLARELGVSRSTAWRDIAAVRAEWAERRLTAYESHLVEDFARTDRAIAAIWERVTIGYLPAIDRLVALIDRRLRLLGLDTVRHQVDLGAVLQRYLERAMEEERADGSGPGSSDPRASDS